jgi:hypothetical protein
MSGEYEAELAAWKAKHGIDSATDETNPEELRMLAEEQAAKGKSWCFGCDQHMPIREMKLITRRTDAYVQIDEGEGDYIAKSNRVRMCPKCFNEQYGDEEENAGTER